MWLKPSRLPGILAALSCTLSAWAGPYDAPAANAVSWLLSQQNTADGSWGATDDIKYVRTSEAVLALAALNRRTPQFYAGLTWLQNHAPSNVDHTARRILAIQSNGGSVTADLQSLQAAQGLAAPGNGGWGLARTYQSAALDTALTLQAYNQAGVSTNVANAVTYLTGAQLTGSDKGWVLGQETTSDPITTAQVLIALIPLKTSYPAVATPISNGLAALNATVTTTSPVAQKALAVVANLRNSASSGPAESLLSNLTATQSGNGSWGDDIFATALVARSLAAGMARDLSAQQQVVNMPDTALRTAVNQALGRNAMDALNIGELSQLTSLNAAGLGITDLTGLQLATNLLNVNLSGNTLNIPAGVDSDSDGVTDQNEIDVGTNLFNSDSKPWFKYSGPQFDYASLVASTPAIGWQQNGAWHAITDDIDHDGDLDLVLYFMGGNEQFYDLSCTYDCGDWYTGPDFGILVYLENVNGVYVRRMFSNSDDLIPGDIEKMLSLDYNNDGKTDLLLVMNDINPATSIQAYLSSKPYQRLVLLKNDSGSAFATQDNPAGHHFSDVTTAVGLGQAAWYAEGLVLDLNQDGYPDILGVSSDANYNVLGDTFVYNPATGTYVVSTTSGLPRPLWFASLADLNGDGKPDVIAQDGTAGLRFFRNNGGSNFTELTNTQNLSDLVGKWFVKFLPADMDNDGITDLVTFETDFSGQYPDWLNAGAKMRLLRNAGMVGNQITVSEQPDATFNSNGNTEEVAYGGTVGDVNNDGLLDIVIAARDGGSRLVATDGLGGYLRPEDTGAVVGLSGPNSRFADPVVVDLNGDGKPDLLSAETINAISNGNYLLFNTGKATGTRNAISIELTGKNQAISPSSGKDAFGALVEVIAGGHTYKQQVLPVMGLSRRLHFGLGAAATGIQVKIYWPDNPTNPQILTSTNVDPYVNSILRVTQP